MQMRSVTAIPVPVEQQNIRSFTLMLAAVGFMPVAAIVLHCASILALKYSTLLVIIPCFIWSVRPGLRMPQIGKLAFEGWCAGIIAVLLYDLSRVPFMLSGWPDFIPKIGEWLLGSSDAPAGLGYLWRYAGNGGGMGMSFFLLLSLVPVNRKMTAGVIYGLFIFSCLMLSLVLIPHAQEAMFRITPLTFAGSLVGHIVYGFVLGCMARRSLLFVPFNPSPLI